MKLKDRGASRLATFRARFKQPGSSQSGLIEKVLPMSIVQDDFAAASGSAQLSVVVASFAEKLRGSDWARGWEWDDLLAMWQQLPPPVRDRAQSIELKKLIQTARRLDTRVARLAAEP